MEWSSAAKSAAQSGLYHAILCRNHRDTRGELFIPKFAPPAAGWIHTRPMQLWYKAGQPHANQTRLLAKWLRVTKGINMFEKLKQKILEWLGLDKLIADLAVLERHARNLQREFDDQMRCVGVDVHLQKGAHTTVVFVSRLGLNGEGTVRAVETYFADYRQMANFMNMLEERYPPEKVWFDTPPQMPASHSKGGRW